MSTLAGKTLIRCVRHFLALEEDFDLERLMRIDVIEVGCWFNDSVPEGEGYRCNLGLSGGRGRGHGWGATLREAQHNALRGAWYDRMRWWSPPRRCRDTWRWPIVDHDPWEKPEKGMAGSS